MTNPRRFRLIRTTDPTGVTGTGHVADGIQWPDGTATVRWRSARPSTVNWDRIEDAETIHGYGGATRIEWTDPDPATIDRAALVVPDSPKMLHETLCFAQSAIGLHPDQNRALEHIARLGRLINECERHRPLGSNGKHGDLHTDTCGCEEEAR
ncbi:hypothetical protein [Nocardiopsis lucentensis]|uniref:hypothetical protein n=1 Tax=Nocardiopsis lucentensis TaxID=53441 RepID=UPI00034DFF40|nr:hypothetical protein [Nocardiopsis lucentensis]